MLQWCYRIWFLLDIYIFIGVVRYGAWQVQSPLIKKNYLFLMVLTTIFWLALYFFFKMDNVGSLYGHDTPIGANSAFIAQFLLSILYVHLILRADPREYFPPAVAWLRTIGSGMNDVFMFIHYPDNHFLHTLCVGSFLLDCTFLYLLYNRPETGIISSGTN